MNKKIKSTTLTPVINKKEKSKRAKYLTARIDELFDVISEWIEGYSYKIKKTKISIDGEKLPAMDILSGKKIVVSIKPAGLYAFGVNSQLNLTSEKETNILFDIAKASSPPDWQLISSEPGKKPKKLTKIIYRNLLKRNE